MHARDSRGADIHGKGNATWCRALQDAEDRTAREDPGKPSQAVRMDRGKEGKGKQ